MEASGQLHAPTASLPEKEPQALPLPGMEPWTFSPLPNHYTAKASPAVFGTLYIKSFNLMSIASGFI